MNKPAFYGVARSSPPGRHTGEARPDRGILIATAITIALWALIISGVCWLF